MEYQEATAIVGKKSGLYDVTTINGIHQRRLFMSQDGRLCEFAPRSRTKGFPIGSQAVEHWTALNPAEPKTTNIVRKFQRYAAKADFTSPFIRKCLEADPEKDCYANGLTTGTHIDGEIISLQAIARYDDWAISQFRKALRERQNYRSCRFDFRGYDGALWLEVVTEDTKYSRKGDIIAGFSKEYRGCGNGYYYTLIDNEHFIGTDID
ncbi:hypothetical protein [uncultured Duncaniella sp.]|uniref:hypothetical protein n=1 Tax=uncultured Duncaniella sp. TaxID=2768039 RepID=UPI002732C484|nr:hypothetical protein [uncultured Duncaniella sp.]